jgi:oligopeptide/dipeptide ABC transporter ATP-binding protein
MPLLDVSDLRVWYAQRGAWLRPARHVRAVDGVSFSLAAGETLGLVGESGCGKSTLGRTIIRLETPTSGSIRLDGRDATHARGADLRELRRKVQMIFQDPYGSLNPRMTVHQALDEVLAFHTPLARPGRLSRVGDLLELVGLRPEHMHRYPHQFSGGQRQRIGIARALAVSPRLIIADEPVSALDVSVQAQIINLLADIQRQTGVAYLFIAHDLAVVEHVSRRILVMYLGHIMESGPAAQVCAAPRHPYTRALLSAVPSLDAATRRKRIILAGDVPSPLAPPAGCPFHPRCPLAVAACRQSPPPLLPDPRHPEHAAACLFPELVAGR